MDGDYTNHNLYLKKRVNCMCKSMRSIPFFFSKKPNILILKNKSSKFQSTPKSSQFLNFIPSFLSGISCVVIFFPSKIEKIKKKDDMVKGTLKKHPPPPKIQITVYRFFLLYCNISFTVLLAFLSLA